MDKATVKKVATLARLAITDAEQEKFATQLSGILKWIEQMSEVDTSAVEPLANVVNIDLKLREDVVNDGGIQADILSNAAETLEGFFVVPKIVE
jgi:aspartyl-tRNA(Asn)/glutamyl-tRNA(Gln) amidotransferase subunit C